jgi:hypothetical protein
VAIVRPLTGQNTNSFYLKDYQHASRTFLAEPGYVMAPKVGFLFFVRLNFNSPGDQMLGGNMSKTISVLCKTADLPKFNFDNEVLNKYNKKEVVAKKLRYEPVALSFHDDVKNTIRNMWITYNQYYIADSKITPEAWNLDDTYLNKWSFNRYGLDQGTDVRNKRFLNTVDIYSMGNQTYAKYSLVNPLITSFDFDRYDYAEGAKVMECQMRLEYETVLYYEGSTKNIPGFGKDSPYYDNQGSTLGSLYPTPAEVAVDAMEKAIVNTPAPKVSQPYNAQPINPPVQISPATLNTVKAVAANSKNTLKSFSFPTAYAITNNSALVDLTGKARLNQQGAIPNAGFVTSNGARISTAAPSSYGLNNTTSNTMSKLVIEPIIPTGLSTAEQAAFMQAYPPLPSSDIRTRQPPYV